MNSTSSSAIYNGWDELGRKYFQEFRTEKLCMKLGRHAKQEVCVIRITSMEKGEDQKILLFKLCIRPLTMTVLSLGLSLNRFGKPNESKASRSDDNRFSLQFAQNTDILDNWVF